MEYKPILDIFDRRWTNMMQHPLYLAGSFLNPSLYYKAKAQDEASFGKFEMGFLDCIERMVSDIEIQDKISHQLEEYKHVRGAFSKELAIKQPDWWHSYRHFTPNLRRITLRILGLTCTSSACENNWSTSEHIHTKKKNRLDQKRLNDLVFVQYYQRLRERFTTRHANPKQFDPICFDDLDETSEWLTGKNLSNDLVHEGCDLTWTQVDEALGASEILEGSNRPRRSGHGRENASRSLNRGRGRGRGGHGREDDDDGDDDEDKDVDYSANDVGAFNGVWTCGELEMNDDL
ncbi:PREDICTED: uncharacterized protein LOC104612073 [Nelumbo nucifera]|uniref:Uncharacterized protein LOC104612073 n=1 Tax=Nelumbo nucifera TaxID=4432 RepID=A0A1U8BCT1_NELNU|nr:PREDICTED: uncharacterized protein LOC104612073 [Nelumbo nucifera]